MNYKKITATLLTATLVVANCVPAFATESSADGNGVVEYDNSEAIVYDSVTVPTLADANYTFTLDPTGQLHEFDPDNYDSGTVYFQSESDAAYIEAAENVNLFTLSKVAVDPTSGKWSTGVVKTVADGAVTELEAGLYVWTPKTTATAGYEKGNTGDFTALTAGNYDKWFKLNDDNASISLRGDYRNGADICDGKIYKDTYTAVTGNKIIDTPADPLSKYVTVAAGNITAVTNLYTDNTGTAATGSDVVYKEAVVKNQGSTNKVYAVNKSTKNKVVKANVTISNVSGIEFVDDASSLTGAEAKMLISATNGTTTENLVASADGSTASATYTVDLAPATIVETTYRSNEDNEATGGKNYLRYEGPNSTFTSDLFYITAATNTGADAKAAWDEWAAGVTSTTRPKFNIVYTVLDKQTDVAPSVAAGILKMKLGEDTEISINFGVGSLQATGISSITYTAAGNTYSFADDEYSIENGKLILSHSKTDIWLNNGVTERTITITFNNTAGTVVTASLEKE